MLHHSIHCMNAVPQLTPQKSRDNLQITTFPQVDQMELQVNNGSQDGKFGKQPHTGAAAAGKHE